MRVRVEDATEAHFAQVAHDIRPADRAEWSAGTGKLFGDAVKDTFAYGGYMRVAIGDDGVPLCFWGCDDGRVWLFATQTAEKYALSLHRVLAPNLKDLLDRWPRLEAYADYRNTVHHKWLQWLGFELVRVVDLPPFGMPFKIYVKEA